MALRPTADPVAAAAALGPLIRAHAAETEAGRQLARPVVDALVEGGMFDLNRPVAFGGAEIDPLTMFRVVEELARHDSAAAWIVAVSLMGNVFLSFYPDEGAEEIFGSPGLVMSGAAHPVGRAERVHGGYRLTGQWQFFSGCQCSTWWHAKAALVDGDLEPVQMYLCIPADPDRVIDTWHTMGMRGTGSHDVRLDGVFVPERRAGLMPTRAPSAAFSGPLYRLTIWPPVALMAVPALGVARAAIDELLDLAATKTATFGGALSRRASAQRQVAEAEARLGAARAFLFEAYAAAWDAALADEPIDLPLKRRMQLAGTHAANEAATAVDLVCTAAGSSAARMEYRFERLWRDAKTITAQAFCSPGRYESVGQVMFGVPSDWPFFNL
ncbi:MAG TPA: acyl-CoA dehydrogenase family protein [Acidimicrobiia bacterium]